MVLFLDWTSFFWQKAIFWIALVKSGIKFTNNYMPPPHYRFVGWCGNDQLSTPLIKHQFIYIMEWNIEYVGSFMTKWIG